MGTSKKSNLSDFISIVNSNVQEEEKKWLGLQILALFQHVLDIKEKEYYSLQQKINEFIDKKLNLSTIEQLID